MKIGQYAKKRLSRANAVKVAKQNTIRAARKESKLMKLETMKKSKAEKKKAAKTNEGKDQLGQQPPLPVTLEWFRMVEEEKDEDSVLYSHQMIIVDIDFNERGV